MTQKSPTAPTGVKKPHNEHNENSEQKSHKPLKLTLFFLFLLIIILILLWLLRGKTTTTGKYPENIKNESLECVSDELIYEKLGSFNEPIATNLVITAVFRGSDSLLSLGIKNLLTFSSNHDAVIAEAKSHANFNFSLQALNYDSGKFDNKFSIIGDKLLVNLTGRSNDINEYDKSYFMIKSDKLPASLPDYQAEYESLGMKCVSTFDENS